MLGGGDGAWVARPRNAGGGWSGPFPQHFGRGWCEEQRDWKERLETASAGFSLPAVQVWALGDDCFFEPENTLSLSH